MIESMLQSDQAFWMVIFGFVIAFALAFGIGANDVANSFGTSVGSKVLTLKQACILATIFEILGSILIGAKVSGTIRKGILDPMAFNGSELELMLGYVSALLGCCIWLIVATVLNLPVSGTHSIVGATIGMALVSRGFNVIQWLEVMKIVASWFISPLLSGLVSMLLFMLIRRYILRAQSPLKSGLLFLPIIYTITIVVNVGGILEASPPLLGFDKIPSWGKFLISGLVGLIVYLIVWLMLVPYMKQQVQKALTISNLKQLEYEPDFKPDHETNDSDANVKKTIATQVDHIQLIMARNYDEWPKSSEKLEEKSQQRNQLVKLQLEGIPVEESSHPQSIQTIHSTHSTNNPFIRNAIKRGRIRFESAPSSKCDDIPDIDDVNLTLSGYLHTIHSPAFRMQLNNLKNNSGLRPIQSNQASQQSAASQAVVTGSAPGLAGNGGSAPLFSKIFSQQHSNPGANPKDEGQVRLLSPTNESSEAQEGKKFGRFFVQAPKKDNLQPALTTADLKKTTSKESLEVDAEVEENISEFRQRSPKKKKETEIEEVDPYAHNDPPDAARLFSFLQVLTAVFGSFAHGGNDVSNAIGPLIGLYLIFQEGRILEKAETPEWILFYGGVGISAGLWILGRRVIKTIGEDLTKITPSSGFVIELASAMTVLGASLLNIPVSTTHCKVGSVVFTGRVRSKQSVDWSLFRNIIIAWIVTVPVTGGIAAACQAILRALFIK